MLKKLQEKHKVWADKNFGNRAPFLPEQLKWAGLELASLTGIIAHSILKSDQGIRGLRGDHQLRLKTSMRSIGSLLTRDDWDVETEAVDHETGYSARIYQATLGAVEEAGELALAIWHSDVDGAKDAIGDIVLYLVDLCNALDFDFESIISEVAEKVHGRDWNQNPRNNDAAIALSYSLRKEARKPVECPKCDGVGWYSYTFDRRPRQQFEEKEHIQSPCEICDGDGHLNISSGIVLHVVTRQDPVGTAEALLGLHPEDIGYKRLYQAVCGELAPELNERLKYLKTNAK